MSTTTIRLPEVLKARIEKLAAAQGASVHGFMVDALSRAADQQERRLAFEAEAERRWKKLLKTGRIWPPTICTPMPGPWRVVSRCRRRSQAA